jgi:hypothetical protein
MSGVVRLSGGLGLVRHRRPVYAWYRRKGALAGHGTDPPGRRPSGALRSADEADCYGVTTKSPCMVK